MNLAGVLAPIPTPFDEQGDVDTARLRTALTRWLRTPLAGFVILGSTGEAPLLDEAEADRVVACARDLVPRGHRAATSAAPATVPGSPDSPASTHPA